MFDCASYQCTLNQSFCEYDHIEYSECDVDTGNILRYVSLKTLILGIVVWGDCFTGISMPRLMK